MGRVVVGEVRNHPGQSHWSDGTVVRSRVRSRARSNARSTAESVVNGEPVARPLSDGRVFMSRISRAIVLVLALLSLGMSPFAAAAAVIVTDESGERRELYSSSYALLIGVSEYTNGWEDLDQIPSELDKARKALETHGFDVTMVMEKTSMLELKSAIDDFIRRHGHNENNRLIIVYSGHGHTWSAGNQGYLVPSDAPVPETEDGNPGELFRANTLHISQMMEWARQMTARHVLFLFDSCFSGMVFKTRGTEDPKRAQTFKWSTNAQPSRQFITAGSAREKVPARSVFMPAFINAITSNEADYSQDGFLTGEELGIYLETVVPRYSDQTPQYGTHPSWELSRGNFVFVLDDSDKKQLSLTDSSGSPSIDVVKEPESVELAKISLQDTGSVNNDGEEPIAVSSDTTQEIPTVDEQPADEPETPSRTQRFLQKLKSMREESAKKSAKKREERAQLTEQRRQRKAQAKEQLAIEKLAAKELAVRELAAEKLAAETPDAGGPGAETLAAEDSSAEDTDAEKLAAETLAAEKLAAEKLEAEKLAAEELAAQKLAQEKLAAEKLAAERRVADQLAAEKFSAKKLAAENKARERQIAARRATLEAGSESTTSNPAQTREPQQPESTVAPVVVASVEEPRRKQNDDAIRPVAKSSRDTAKGCDEVVLPARKDYFASTELAVVKADLTMFMQPNHACRSDVLVSAGSGVVLLAKHNSWVHLRHKASGKTGWIHQRTVDTNLGKESEAASASNVTGADQTVVSRSSSAEQVAMVEQPGVEDSVRTTTTASNCDTEALRAQDYFSEPRHLVTVEAVDIVSTPDDSCPTISVIGENSGVVVLGSKGTWIHVRDKTSGNRGWVKWQSLFPVAKQ